MKYRINTYDRKYIMINIIELAELSDLEQLSNETFSLTYNIYLEWMKLLENNNNQITTYDIALNRNNPLKKYLTKRDYTKTKKDKSIYLYENAEFKQIDLTSKVKTRRRTK